MDWKAGQGSLKFRIGVGWGGAGSKKFKNWEGVGQGRYKNSKTVQGRLGTPRNSLICVWAGQGGVIIIFKLLKF